MKKTLSILLAAVLLMTLAACGGAPAETTVPPTTEDPFVSAVIDGEKVIFDPWLEAGIPTSGTYHLTQDVELTAPVKVSGELRLHLNGFRITGQSNAILQNMFVIPAGASMVLCEDEGDPGTVVSSRSFAGLITVSSMFLVGGELTVLGGHIDASPINIEGLANGLGIYIQSGGTVTIGGGTVTGGTAWRAELNPEDGVYFGDGGTIHIEKGAVCNITGGTVQNGSAARGGNIFIAADPEDPENDGVLNITGGTILSGESLFEGGNIFVQGDLTMSGGEITGGESYGHAGNMYITGDVRATGGTIAEGQCDINKQSQKRGGNITVNGIDATVYMENVQILDGKTTTKESHGGNICIIEYGAASFEVKNSVLSGGSGHRGGNLYIGHFAKDIPDENLDYVFSGTTFQDGIVTYRGSSFCLDSDDKTKIISLTLNDCKLLETQNSGAINIAMGAGSTEISYLNVTMNGGEINGGITNVFGSGVLTLNDVKLTDYNPSGSGQHIINE